MEMAVLWGRHLCFLVILFLHLSVRLSYGKLYSSADHIVLLENNTITEVIHQSRVSWIVEFYSSWCGHCHAFAPTWKRLANMAKDWKQLVRVAAIDCAEERNLATCQHYEIEGYPTVKFFNASADISHRGKPFDGDKTLLNLLHEMVKLAELQRNLGLVRVDVDFNPVGKEFVSSFLAGQTPYDELALIFEVPTSFIGREIVLDMMKYPRLGVRRVLNKNTFLIEKYKVKKFPSLILVHRRGTFRELSTDEKTHAGFKKSLDDRDMDIKQITDPPEVIRAMEVYKSLHGKADEKKKEAGKSSEVYMHDLESGLAFMIKTEVASKRRIRGKEYVALKKFVGLLAECFPGREALREIFNSIYNNLSFMPRKHQVDREEYVALVHSSEMALKTKSGDHRPLPTEIKWVGCLGSEPQYRGYPCSLWTLFHTLTVNCANKRKLSGLEVLHRIRDYIQYFFTCEECRKHFTNMSSNLQNEVRSHTDAILWLWRSHNKVNKRLAGDRSEDPQHPKIQFPSKDLCEECRFPNSESSGEIRWNEGVVLEFLKNHYGVDNIRIKYPAARAPPELKDSDIVSKQFKRNFITRVSVIGLTSIDTSLCLILYSAIALAVIALYVYFIRKRRRRIKLHIHTP